MMHVGLKMFDPDADSGSGLDREYEAEHFNFAHPIGNDPQSVCGEIRGYSPRKTRLITCSCGESGV